MTTTDEALIEQFSLVLCDNNGDDPDDRDWYRDDARAVLPIIRKAQADAWEDGYNDGVEDALNDAPVETPNPHAEYDRAEDVTP